MTEAAKRRQDPQNLVWIDLEMTGLDPQKCVILQAALIVTDRHLNPLESYCADVWQPSDALATMTPFVRKMHDKNGLLERVARSDKDLQQVEQELLARITGWCPYRPYLCGNSIGSDRKFINNYMPALDGYLHYRMVDVSSLKVLTELWHPQACYSKPKTAAHDALFDIEQSIEELGHYRKTVLRESRTSVLPARPL